MKVSGGLFFIRKKVCWLNDLVTQVLESKWTAFFFFYLFLLQNFFTSLKTTTAYCKKDHEEE